MQFKSAKLTQNADTLQLGTFSTKLMTQHLNISNIYSLKKKILNVLLIFLSKKKKMRDLTWRGLGRQKK